jgi:dethiobiotin synthetase
MGAGVWFITGTDTGVGKTVLTVLLTRHLRERGQSALAVKPLCSGGRGDARLLQRAQGSGLSLDEVNPWHFRAPLAPLLAARRQGLRVRLPKMLAYLRRMRSRCDLLLVEGAGGLLSPLGEGFDARTLLGALAAGPIVVCPNRLGAVNQALLVLAALPPAVARRAPLVLVTQPKPDASANSNRDLLAELLCPGRVFLLPRLDPAELAGRQPFRPRVRSMLDRLVLAQSPGG